MSLRHTWHVTGMLRNQETDSWFKFSIPFLYFLLSSYLLTHSFNSLYSGWSTTRQQTLWHPRSCASQRTSFQVLPAVFIFFSKVPRFLIFLLQRSTAVQVRSSVRLMPQNQPSCIGLLPSATAWSLDQHHATMLADVSRNILGRTEGRVLGFGQLVRTHTGNIVSEMSVLFRWALRPQCPVHIRKTVVCWARSSLQTGSRCAWYSPFSFFQPPLYREWRSVLAFLQVTGFCVCGAWLPIIASLFSFVSCQPPYKQVPTGLASFST